MKRWIVSCMVAVLSASCTVSGLEAGAEYVPEKKKSAPAMTAQLSEAAWKTVPVAGEFRTLGSLEPSPLNSSIQVCYDDEALFVRCVAFDPDLFTRGNDFLAKNSVELFLIPDKRPGGSYLQLIAAPNGKVEYARMGSEPLNPESFQVRGQVSNQDHYIVDFRIPFATLSKMPERGDIWRFSVARNAVWSGKRHHSSLTPARNGFADVSNFASLRFPAPASSRNVAVQLQNRNEQEYEQTVRDFKDIMEKLAKYPTELKRLHLETTYRELDIRSAKIIAGKGSLIRKNREMRQMLLQARTLQYHFRLRSVADPITNKEM